MRYRSHRFVKNSDPWTLENLSFHVDEGECVGIVGNNGSGKSTLLKCCAGLMAPCYGQVLYRNRPESRALLSLQAGFEAHLSGDDNLIMKGLLMGMSKSTMVSMLDELMAFAELEDVRHQLYSTYSVGMKARLGFAFAVHAPIDFYLIDEIMSVGDESFRRTSAEALKRQLQSGKSALLVSHQMQTLKTFCHRVLWLDAGTLKLEGDPESVCDAYVRASRLKRQLS
jgi:ABC-type polysaccharide/polyol phosphate transport system ATPase subunit